MGTGLSQASPMLTLAEALLTLWEGDRCRPSEEQSGCSHHSRELWFLIQDPGDAQHCI